jgi:hypothetical protein
MRLAEREKTILFMRNLAYCASSDGVTLLEDSLRKPLSIRPNGLQRYDFFRTIHRNPEHNGGVYNDHP